MMSHVAVSRGAVAARRLIKQLEKEKRNGWFSKGQRIIDDYLAASGRNMFHPAEFVDWLGGQPDHEAYEWFYGMEDQEAARQWRIQMARQMASGLRIVVQESDPEDQVVSISVREYPTFISPVSLRKKGGGYERFDPDSEDSQRELRRQAATALATWLGRYRGCAENFGLNLTPIEEIAEVLREKGESDVQENVG
jgi:hypothetical protein